MRTRFGSRKIIESIEKLKQIEPALLFFSHGGATSEASRIIQVALNNEQRCTEAAFKAIRAGEDQEKIGLRLAGILAEDSDLTPEEIRAFPYFTSMAVAGYRQSLKTFA